jgi:nucleoid DNA-binding protein
VAEEEARNYFKTFEEVVAKSLRAGEEIQIMGFGKFYVREQKAREGRNLQTGKKMQIAASKVPAFSAGSAFKGSV